MAKRREKPPENPLSADLIAAAVAPVVATPRTAEAAQPTKKSNESAKQAKKPPPREQKTLRVRFPKSEFEDNAALTRALRKVMGNSKVTESDITRALWSLVRQAEDTMGELRSKAPKKPRPANGDWLAKAEYDDEIARFLHLAIKKMGLGE